MSATGNLRDDHHHHHLSRAEAADPRGGASRLSEHGAEYRDVPGLVRKAYVLSDDGATAGGVYLWKSRADAEAMYTPAWRAFVRERYGSDPSIMFFESPVIVDNDRGEIVSDE